LCSGADTVAAIQARSPDVPIVVLTGIEEEELALACLQAGAQDFLPKHDLSSAALSRAISQAITRLHLRRDADEAGVRVARELRERLAAIAALSKDAIISVTLDGKVTSWNKVAARAFGPTADEALGRDIWELVPAGTERGPERLQAFLRRAIADGEAAEEFALPGQTDPRIYAVDARLLSEATGEVSGLAVIFRDISELRRRGEELAARNAALTASEERLRALAVRLTEIRETERTRISREIHDELGQLLTGLKLDLRWVARRLEANPAPLAQLQDKLADIERMIESALRTAQRIAIELRPSALDGLGIEAAIRDEARRFGQRVGIDVHVESSLHVTPGPEVTTALFRAAQELLTNTSRHAAASAASIALSEADGGWVLRVADNGVGLPPSHDDGLPGLGLLGITERVSIVGGRFSLRPNVPNGTLAEVYIPFPAEA
jgi:two-component system sensor histidine kinase UhpB